MRTTQQNKQIVAVAMYISVTAHNLSINQSITFIGCIFYEVYSNTLYTKLHNKLCRIYTYNKYIVSIYAKYALSHSHYPENYWFVCLYACIHKWVLRENLKIDSRAGANSRVQLQDDQCKVEAHSVLWQTVRIFYQDPPVARKHICNITSVK